MIEAFVDGYSTETASKGQHQMKQVVADFRGALKVTDASTFVAAMERGIGKSKALGCGLLLLA